MIEFRIDWIVPFVFQGEMTSTISCHNKEIPYLSKKKETFLDIQLDIINMTNIYEAFDVSSNFSLLGIKTNVRDRKDFVYRSLFSLVTRIFSNLLPILMFIFGS